MLVGEACTQHERSRGPRVLVHHLVMQGLLPLDDDQHVANEKLGINSGPHHQLPIRPELVPAHAVLQDPLCIAQLRAGLEGAGSDE